MFSFFKRFYLLIYLRDREKEQAGGGAEGEEQADATLSMSPMWDSIPHPKITT